MSKHVKYQLFLELEQAEGTNVTHDWQLIMESPIYDTVRELVEAQPILMFLTEDDINHLTEQGELDGGFGELGGIYTNELSFNELPYIYHGAAFSPAFGSYIYLPGVLNLGITYIPA
jgi:hypothetical protein